MKEKFLEKLKYEYNYSKIYLYLKDFYISSMNEFLEK